MPPWITDEFISLIHERDSALAKAHRTNTEDDWAKAKHLRNKVNNVTKRVKRDYFEQEINSSSDSKTLWKTLKKILPNKSSIGLQTLK